MWPLGFTWKSFKLSLGSLIWYAPMDTVYWDVQPEKKHFYQMVDCHSGFGIHFWHFWFSGLLMSLELFLILLQGHDLEFVMFSSLCWSDQMICHKFIRSSENISCWQSWSPLPGHWSTKTEIVDQFSGDTSHCGPGECKKRAARNKHVSVIM